MQIPLVDLAAQYRALKPEIEAAVLRVLESTRYILGPEGEALEREVAAYCGAAHAVGVASGTDALHLALRACGVGPGHEVITAPLTFFASAEAILHTGATPRFVDVDPRTLTLDPKAVEEFLGRHRNREAVKAILPVHLYGSPADMEALGAIAQRHDLRLIEDAAQALGAVTGGRKVGGLGDAGCISFYPSKVLGACGEGGMVVTNDGDLAARIRRLRHHGHASPDVHAEVGYNSRLDEIQAAILRVKLRHLDEWIAARRERATLYTELLAGGGVDTPSEAQGTSGSYYLYTIRSPRRDAIQAGLAEAAIEARVYYPSPVYRQPALRQIASAPDSTPHAPRAEQACREILSLPLYPELPLPAVRQVAAAVLTLAKHPPEKKP
jgi:dTDP-4-amino-4,6-dideoxygalactose transaminase